MPDNKRNYKICSDEELIAFFQKEDIDAFNEIVDRYKDKLVNFIFRYTGSKEESEDIAQETFIKLYLNKKLYRDIAKFSTWFYTIALNITRTYKKKESKISTISISDYDPEHDKDFDIRSTVRNPEEEAGSVVESDYIQKAINSLEENFRAIIVLRDIEELEYEEISEILDIPLGTVKSRINRAREKLKDLLKDIYREN
ncbi:MAG: sigma-70 family RNA polymerase sigma factor [Ignavibacteria bacterium]|nr:sigma-70 family RNA polymerase sigma factor [Ignavibacteria bacterium]